MCTTTRPKRIARPPPKKRLRRRGRPGSEPRRRPRWRVKGGGRPRRRLQQRVLSGRTSRSQYSKSYDYMQAMQELDPSLTDQQAIDRMVAEFQDSRELFAYLEDQLAGLRMYSDVTELNAFGGSWHCRIGSQLLQRADQCPGRSLGGKGRSLLSAVRSNQPRQVRAPLRAVRLQGRRCIFGASTPSAP